MNSARAAILLELADLGMSRSGQYARDVNQQYELLLERPEVIAAKKPPDPNFFLQRPSDSEAQKRWNKEYPVKLLTHHLFSAGRRCILCGGPAEWRRLAKKGHHQACRYCVTTLFVHSPLGLAGVMIRSVHLPWLIKTGRTLSGQRRIVKDPPHTATRYGIIRPK